MGRAFGTSNIGGRLGGWLGSYGLVLWHFIEEDRHNDRVGSTESLATAKGSVQASQEDSCTTETHREPVEQKLARIVSLRW